MAKKTRKVTIRLEEDEYRRLEQVAKAQQMSVSDSIRLRLTQTPEAFNLAVMDHVANVLLRDIAQEVDRWRVHWQQHPEALLQVPPRLAGREDDERIPGGAA